MSSAAFDRAHELFERLAALPASEKGEIIDGELYTQPRPRPRHSRFVSALAHFLGGPADYDEHGPGGWVVLIEPGIELPRAPEIAPDLASWRAELFEWPSGDDPIRLVPEWVCEVLSPSNAAYDRKIKFPFYAAMGVAWLWVVDPSERTLEVRRLADGAWVVDRVFAGDEIMRAPPFEAIAIPLGRLWVTS